MLQAKALHEKVKAAVAKGRSTMTAVERYHGSHADIAASQWADYEEAAHRLRARGLNKAAAAVEMEAKERRRKYSVQARAAGDDYSAAVGAKNEANIAKIVLHHQHLG